jgi:serine/threonine protein kinase
MSVPPDDGAPDEEAFRRAWWFGADPDPEAYILEDASHEEADRVRSRLLRLRLELDRELDRRIGPFQAAWRAGGRPAIEDHLGDAEGIRRRRLLHELLQVELYWRSRRGEPVLSDDYHGRFPNDADAVAHAFVGRFRPHAWRFRRAEFIGRGALGEVYKVWDVELGRFSALKGVRPEFASQAACGMRLEREARIMARLDHPGVVAVIASGRDENDRPFFVMQYVRGHGFDRDIRAFHRRREALLRLLGRRHQRPGRRLRRLLAWLDLDRSSGQEFRALLARFARICSTMAHAHGRGVIHRDLKPQNIWVGHDDEVWVMDWGLATIAGEDDGDHLLAEDEPTGAAAATLHVSLKNGVVGTPEYMGPDQARGARPLMRFDMFGLGAILYHILTGRAPGHAVDRARIIAAVESLGDEETARGLPKSEMVARLKDSAPSGDSSAGGPVRGLLRRVVTDPSGLRSLALKVAVQLAREGRYPPVRSINPGAPPALQAICERLMAPPLAARGYQNPAEAARDVRAWLANEAVEAYDEPPLARLSRYTRRHRTVALAAVAAVVVVTWASAAAVVSEANRRASEADRTAAVSQIDAMVQACEEIGRARFPGPDRPSLDAIEAMVRMRSEVLHRAADYFQASADRAGNRDAVIEALLRTAELQASTGSKARAVANVERAIGLLKARGADRQSAAVRDRLRLAKAYHDLASLLVDAGKTDRAIQQFQAARSLRVGVVPALGDEAEALIGRTDGYLGDVYLRARCYEQAELWFKKSLERRKALHDRVPEDPERAIGLARGYNNLGRLAVERGQPREAIPHHKEAEELIREAVARPSASDDDRSDLAWTQAAAGDALRLSGDPAGAERRYNESLATLRDLRKGRPYNVDYLGIEGSARIGLARIGGRDSRSHATEAFQIFGLLKRLNPDVTRYDADFRAAGALAKGQTPPEIPTR